MTDARTFEERKKEREEEEKRKEEKDEKEEKEKLKRRVVFLLLRIFLDVEVVAVEVMSSRGDDIETNEKDGSASASAPSKELKEEESCSDVTISDDEEAKVVPHMRVGGSNRQRKRQKRRENVVVEQKKKKKPPPPRELIPGEVVWAKIPSFPWWPAQVLVPNDECLRIRHNKKDIFGKYQQLVASSPLLQVQWNGVGIHGLGTTAWLADNTPFSFPLLFFLLSLSLFRSTSNFSTSESAK